MKILNFLLIILGAFSCKTSSPTTNVATYPTIDWAFPYFEKVDSLNPILKPSASQTFVDPISKELVHWESRNVLNPTAVVRGDSVFLLYRAQDGPGTSRIGLATSHDGLHFRKAANPVFFPAADEFQGLEWNHRKVPGQSWPAGDLFDGVEDPRVVEAPDGNYIMTYTAYDGKTARLCVAYSKDLIDWVKVGPVLRDKVYADFWSKSGAIVCRREGERIIAQKIEGKYWMYFGDTKLFMATSTDLLNWTPLLDGESGQLIEVLHPRRGYFDSRLVEPGPYALNTDAGILLIYNSSNAENFNEPTMPKFTYSAAQALFAKNAPYRLISRTDTPFIKPDKNYERKGEVNEVCFVEGLVYFHDKWLLYYGTADSRIAVATYKR